MLHFFDGGVADGLACLEEAWLDYADEVAVLALNPVDGDVSVYAEGKKLPVAACDSGWLRALKLTDFPTTVVVDRYGIISLIYSGNLGDADIYRDVFAFFARNDYTAELVENIESIIGKEMQGTLENPYEADGSADISASVTPGGMVYYNIYDVQDMLLQIYSANAWVMYEGQAYYPENGVIALNIDTVDPETPVTLGIGNAGANTELFVARLSFREGTQGNPIPVDLGEHNIHLLEGDERGRFITYKAVMPGVLRFKCAVDPENPWILAATNRSSGVKISSEKDLLTDEVTCRATAYLAGEGKLEAYCFRDKRVKNDGHTVSCTVSGEERAVSMGNDPFNRLYMKCLTFRPSCYSCPYTRWELPFDLTIGDFWGVEKVYPELADGMGTSLVIARTAAGKALVAAIEEAALVREVTREQALQPALREPARETMLRKLLYRDLARKDETGHCDMALILKKFGG